MNYHKLHGLNNRDLFSYDSGGQKSAVRVSARPPLKALGESPPLPSSQLLVALWSFLACRGVALVSAFVGTWPFYKDTGH